MATRWEQSFRELKEYIATHPAIEIGEAVSIPSEFRTEFYGRFDKIRESVIDDILAPALLEKALVLSQKYAEIEKEIIHKFSLKEIILDQRLKQFLHDPKQVLIEELYFPLFHLLKGKIDQETFQKNGAVLSSRFQDLYQQGYCKWISLAFLKAFKAKRIGLCNMRFDAKSQMRGHLTEDSPRCIAVDYIEFNNNKPFVVPDFAAYSPDCNCYMAVKTDMQRGGVNFAYNSDSTETRKWKSLNPGLKIFTQDNIFIYVSSTMEEISLLVNKAICCPDAMIRYFPQDDWYTQERWQETLALHEALNLRRTYIIGQSPRNNQYQADNRIKIIDAGFDQSWLSDAVNELVIPFRMAVSDNVGKGAKSRIANWLKRITFPFSSKTPESKYL